ncbi:MAG: erythromycin esterase family protein [Planctomycetota bacterium]
MIGIDLQRYAALMGTLLMSATALGQAQFTLEQGERVADIRARSVEVASIDPRLATDDFADLMPLKDAIGDARVVWLGEQSHGEGAAFLAKGRLVKFLHQEMGFDVLVWEAGLASGPLVDEAMRDPQLTALEAANRSIFTIWSEAVQVHPLLEYVKQTQSTDRRIVTAGMDAQLTGDMGSAILRRHVADLFEPLGRPPEEALEFADWIDAFWTGGNTADAQRAIDEIERTLAMIAEVEAELDAAHEPWRASFVERSLSDAASFLRGRVAFIEANNDITKIDRELLNDRDRRMGDNLVFLANEVYPDRKLIVWAATFHGVYDLKAITPPFNPRMYDTMFAAGKTAHEELGDDLYHIAFVAEGGEVRNVFGMGMGRIPPRPAGSFEHLLGAIEHPYVFTDLRGLPADHWLREKTMMAPLGQMTMQAVWPDQFDGVFAIETEFPPSRETFAPEGYALTVGE